MYFFNICIYDFYHKSTLFVEFLISLEFNWTFLFYFILFWDENHPRIFKHKITIFIIALYWGILNTYIENI